MKKEKYIIIGANVGNYTWKDTFIFILRDSRIILTICILLSKILKRPIGLKL